MFKIFIFLLLACEVFANVSVTKSETILRADYLDANLAQLKQKVLEKAKLKASKEIYGEFMATQSVMEDGHIVDDVIRIISGGVIHIKGEPKYSVDSNSVSVTINAYATDADLSKGYASIPMAIKKKKSMTKKGFTGLWYGFAMDKNMNSSSVEISITDFSQAVINYKSRRCAGDLIVEDKKSKKVIFKEILTFGKDRCKNNLIITLQKITPKSLEFIQQQGDKTLLRGRLYLVK